MLSREICVFNNNPVSSQKGEAKQISENSKFVQKHFVETIKENSALVFSIIWYQCVVVSVSVFV